MAPEAAGQPADPARLLHLPAEFCPYRHRVARLAIRAQGNISALGTSESSQICREMSMGWKRRVLRGFMARWSDGRRGFYLFDRFGLLLWRAWELAIVRFRFPARSLVTVDYAYRAPERNEVLVKSVLQDYELALEQAHMVAKELPLSAQWLDYMDELSAGLQPDLLHDFRRNRLCMYGLCAGGAILDEDERDLKLTFSNNYVIGKGSVFRSGWTRRSAHEFTVRVVSQFHRIGRLIDPGVLAMVDEDPIGAPITPVHQGKHLTLNLLLFAYYVTNLLRHTDLSATRAITVCEIGGGYGGFAKLFKQTFRKATAIVLDLPECLALSSFYLRSNFPEARIGTVREFPWDAVLDDERVRSYDFVLLPWWYIERLSDECVDLFFNSASMQEMTREYIDFYIEHIQRAARGYFYWINRWKAPERYGGVCFADYPLDNRWRAVFVRSGEESPTHLHEWLAVRRF